MRKSKKRRAPVRRRAFSVFPSSVESLEARAMLTGTVVPGLVASWNLDEGPDWHDAAFQSQSTAVTAHDSVGENHASLTHMTGDAWISGQQFTGLEFDGVDDFLTLSNSLGETLADTVSVAFWIKTTQTGSSTPSSSPAVLGNDFIQFGGIDAAGRLGLSINDQWLVRTPAAVNDGQWHFVAFTRHASTGVVRVFLDGQLPVSSAGPGASSNSAVTAIGRRTSPLPDVPYFDGRLDQISIFNYDLEVDAVRQLMHNYAPKTWDTSTVVVSGQSFSTASAFYNSFDAEGDSLSVVSFTQPGHGTAIDNHDGTFQYQSQAGFVGNDQFDVVIEDGHGGFSRTTMFIQVVPASSGNIHLYTTQFDDFAEISAGGTSISYAASWRIPRAVDWDGDGKQDLLVSADDAVWLYHNSGSAETPVFDAGVKVQAAGADISTGSTEMSMTLADLTGDGVDDLIISDAVYKLRLYENTSPIGQTPVYAAPVLLQSDEGSDLTLANPRFELGDWNNDGLLDIILGTFDGDVNVFLNVGTDEDPVFDATALKIHSEAHNFYPRFIDLSRNGTPDLVRGINWGDVRYWLDPIRYGNILGDSPAGYLSITTTDGSVPKFQNLTDGPVVDFADFNGDGVLDIVIGGQLAGSHVFIAFGEAKTVSDHLADLEAIYDAHPNDLGTALEANGQELLSAVNQSNLAIISLMNSASPADREAMFTAFAAHVSKYSFLRLKELDPTFYHHVPSLVSQDILIAGNLRTDTPAHRLSVANLFEMTGLHREIYLEFGMVVGDNVRASEGQLQSILTFLQNHPRASYADQRLTLNHFFGDGEGASVDNFGQSKNTFSDNTGLAIDEWAADLRAAIVAVKPGNPTSGDLFTFVVGHEATHSLDAYVRSRANTDLARRWGQYLILAGGPDMVAGADGFLDGLATQQHFFEAGLWDGQQSTWDQAWENYWSTGPGASIGGVNNLRGNIKFLLENPQESLATQGNQHWGDSEGRLIGAIDRFQRGITPDLTEALTFLDYMSVGMNRVPMFDIEANAAEHSADWNITFADLERDDRGYITRVTMSNGRDYTFTVNSLGVYTGVTGPTTNTSNLAPVIILEPELLTAGKDEVAIDPLATISDGDSQLVFASSVLTVSGTGRKETLAIRNHDGINVKGKTVTYIDTVIGTVAGGKKGAALTVRLLAAASQQAVQTLLRNTTVKSKEKAAGNRTIKVQITNINGADTNAATRQVRVGK